MPVFYPDRPRVIPKTTTEETIDDDTVDYDEDTDTHETNKFMMIGIAVGGFVIYELFM